LLAGILKVDRSLRNVIFFFLTMSNHGCQLQTWVDLSRPRAVSRTTSTETAISREWVLADVVLLNVVD